MQQRLASTLREYETTKLGLTQEMEAITKEEEKNDAEGPVEEEEVTE